MPTKKIAVVGAGSAGLLTAAHLCTWLDDSWHVSAVYDPRKPILGIGESTNGGVMSVLERATNFSLARPEDLAALDATIKYGSRFTNWRPHVWVNPLLSGNIAIHFNNRRLRDFVVERLLALWPRQFSVIETEVREVQNYTDHVTLRTEQGERDFDYVVDCTGTPASLDGYTLSDCTLMDCCRVHVVEDYRYEPFTDHVATRDGWMFGVPLEGYKTYGYLYSRAFTADGAAEDEMKRLLGAKALDARAYHARYEFRSYYANELVSGRVCKNGNRALFFEPLLANSMFLYVYAARLIYDYITGAPDGASQDPDGRASRCNRLFVKAVQEMEDVISYYYKGGSTFDTEVWRTAADRARARLERRTQFHEYLEKLRALKSHGLMHAAPGYAFSPHTWQIVDEQLGYRSFELLRSDEQSSSSRDANPSDAGG
jgi:hypothetical protein